MEYKIRLTITGVDDKTMDRIIDLIAAAVSEVDGEVGGGGWYLVEKPKNKKSEAENEP